jgi:hypothetical protein
MVTGSTSEFVTLLESSKEMHKNTMKQFKSKGKKLSKEIKSVYTDDGKSKISPIYEPKMANRWFLKFPKESNISEWYVKALTRPTYPFNIGGKINVVLYDSIEPSTTGNLMKLIEKQKPFELKIEVLDPLAEVIEKWTLEGCVITSVQWGTLDYQSKDISTIYVEVSYNKVKFKNK